MDAGLLPLMATTSLSAVRPRAERGAETLSGGASRYRWCVMKAASRVSFVLSLVVASLSTSGRVVAAMGPAWLPGPGTTGDNTSFVGAIDAPMNEARISRTGAL